MLKRYVGGLDDRGIDQSIWPVTLNEEETFPNKKITKSTTSSNICSMFIATRCQIEMPPRK